MLYPCRRICQWLDGLYWNLQGVLTRWRRPHVASRASTTPHFPRFSQVPQESLQNWRQEKTCLWNGKMMAYMAVAGCFRKWGGQICYWMQWSKKVTVINNFTEITEFEIIDRNLVSNDFEKTFNYFVEGNERKTWEKPVLLKLFSIQLSVCNALSILSKEQAFLRRISKVKNTKF